MDINEAIQIAKRDVKDQAAQVYLNAIPLSIEEYGSEGFQTQLLYVLSNLNYWRGPVAKEVKGVMKAYLKSKGKMK